MLHPASERDAAISADRSTVVGTYLSSNGPEAFRWLADGSFQGLGDLPGAPFESKALDVDANGDHIVGFGQASSGRRAIQWTEASGMTELGANAIEAHGVSANGSVIVGRMQSSAFRWTAATGAVVIPPLSRPGFAGAGAYSVSADGSVVVGFNTFRTSISALTDEAFRWSETTGSTSLESPGWSHTVALDVSSNGDAVVGTGLEVGPGASGGSTAFYWSASTGMISLSDLLNSLGATGLGGWNLVGAEGISGNGLTVVGTAQFEGGHLEAFVAAIPEPPTFVLLALGAIVLLGFYLRKHVLAFQLRLGVFPANRRA
jgi:uncharacterized membrane protein